MKPYTPPPPRSNLLWLAVDFDGTLAEHVWTPEDASPSIGQPIWPNVTKLQKAVREGWKISIHTARSWADYETIESWLNHYRVPFDKIHCGKLLAAAYIDDRAIRASDQNWTPAT